MKKFVAKKLYLSFFASCILLAIICGYFSFLHYQQHRSETYEEQFAQQLQFVDELGRSTQSLNGLLRQGAKIIYRYVLNAPMMAIEELYYEFDAVDNLSNIHFVDLIEPDRHQQVEDFEPSHSSYLLRTHQQVIEPILGSLLENKFISSAIAISMKDTEFSYYGYGKEQQLNQLFDWMLHNRSDLDEAKQKHAIVYPPSLKTTPEEPHKNYLLMPVIVTKSGFLFLAIQFDDYFGYTFGESSEHDTDPLGFVMWHSESGTTLATNVEIDGQSFQHTYFPTRYLPDVLHPISREKDKFHQGRLEMTYEPGEGLVSLGRSWSTLIYDIKHTPYRLLFFRDSDHLVKEVIMHSLEYALMLFAGSVFVLLFVFALIIWKLAYPTSNLIAHIERQSSLYDSEDKLAVKGWEKWFDKISLSFRDNRKLLQSLMEKNKQLDDKVQQRTVELQRETTSKDRNIALNRAIMNSIPDMIYYKNLDGGFLGCNSAFEYFAGTSEADLVARTAEEVFDEKLAEELTKYDFQTLKSKRPFNGKSWHVFPNQSNRYINWLIAPIINREGDVLGLIGLGRDITAQEESLNKIEQAKENAVKANAAKSEFIANMSHEIRTPMNAVMGMIELMQASSPSPLQSSYLNTAQTSSRHLLNVINDILDFSKVSANKIELHREVFSVSEVFAISFANSLPEAISKQLKLDIQLPKGFPEYFVGDKVRLNQVFTNLIGNAVKFTDAGEITLSSKVLPNTGKVQTVEFVIEDTGVGIPKEKQKAVFEAFTQADSSITREYGGTGLGLTIVYQLVKIMGGNTRLESKQGEGTKFTITLPLERVSEQPNLEEVERNWLVCEPDHWISRNVIKKLKTVGASYKTSSIELLEHHDFADGEVLLLRLESLNALTSGTKRRLLNSGVVIQPLVYQLTSSSIEELASFNYLPILTVPFSVQSLLFNQLQPLLGAQNPTVAAERVLRQKRILIVEDNEVNRQVLELILTNAGAEVVSAIDGVDGFEKAQKSLFDCVILDVQMPVMDGLTCCKEIRKLSEYENAPIIAMTAHSSKDDIDKSKQAGFDVHLSKPIEKERLLSTIQALLNAPKTRAFASHTDEANAEFVDLDLEFLARQFGGNMEAVSTILQRFKETKREDIDDLAVNWQQLEQTELKSRLHNIKGMLGNIGAVKSQKLTAKLERSVIAGETLNELFDTWSAAMEALFEQVDLVVKQD